VYQFITVDWSALQGRPLMPVALAALLAAALYAASGGLLAAAWWRLLSASSSLPIALTPAAAIYARTQIYKYLPTNMLHVVGRHASARSLGASHAALVSAAVLEFVGVIVAAGLVVALFGAGDLMRYSAHADFKPNAAFVLAAAGGVIIALGAVVATLLVRSPDAPALLRRHLRAFAWALALYAVFFVISGLVLWLLARGATAHPGSVLRSLVAVVTTAWLLGFVVPGAPAGLGIREAIMIMMLQPQFGEASALLLAALYRVATFGGDALFAAFGFWLGGSRDS
jgi:uncharacterized membrane protein YbhN (UPF0104 family)